VSPCKICNCSFDFGHAGAAVPAGGHVVADLSRAMGLKFTVGCQQQLLIR
jgi:hypothetical protein